MKTKNEHLSAVFDGEAGDFEQRRLLNELEKDKELQQDWANYALIGDVMRESAAPATEIPIADPDFLSSIQLRLEEEDAYSNVALRTPKAAKPRWLQPLSGIAVAATVAAISVVSMQSFMTAENTVGNPAPSLQASLHSEKQNTRIVQASYQVPASAPKALNTEPLDSEQITVNMDERTKMQRYLASHIRNASHRTIAPNLRMLSTNYY